MRILNGAALGAIGLLASTAPAFAQDQEFSGPYVGVSLGHSFQQGDKDETIRFDRDRNGSFGDTVVTLAAGAPNAFSPGFCGGSAVSSTNTGCRDDRDGTQYAARLGYDVQMGNVVVGLVGDIGKTQISDSVTGFSTTPASYTMTRSIDWNAGLRLRAGYAAGGRTLVYATGGGAYAKVDHGFATSNTVNSFTTVSENNDVWGWAAGGGVEQKVGKNFSIGVEYLYTRLNDKDYTVRAGALASPATPLNNAFLLGGAGTDFRRSDNRFESHGVRATAAFRF